MHDKFDQEQIQNFNQINKSIENLSNLDKQL